MSVCLAVASGAGVAACVHAPPPTVDAWPTAPREPDGVVLEPEPAIPAPAAGAEARGVVTLAPPVGDGEIRGVVQSFFDALARRDDGAVDALLSRSARLLDAHGGSTYATLREELRSKSRALAAAGMRDLPLERIERFDYRDLGEAGERPLPPEARPGDVLVRVHLAWPWTSGDRVFADVVVLLLRRELGGEVGPAWRVAGYDEQES